MSNEKTETAGDFLQRLGMDGKLWTDEFIKTVEKDPSIATDFGTMIGWFANAIMAGHDRGYRKGQADLRAEAVQGVGFDKEAFQRYEDSKHYNLYADEVNQWQREQSAIREAELRALLRECKNLFRSIEVSLRSFRFYSDVPKEIGGQIYCDSSDMYEKLNTALGEK